jgi:hypothetical protein
MSLYAILQMGGYLLLALAGMGLSWVGVYGSVRVRLLRFERSFTLKQRLQFTLFGLVLVVVAFTSLAGVAGEM